MFDKRGNAPAILALVFVLILSIGLSAFIFVTLKKEQAKSASLQTELNDVKDKLLASQAQFEDSKKMIKGLEGKLAENLSQLESLSRELEQEKASKEEALAQAQQLKADFEQQRALRSDLESKFSQTQEVMKKIQAQMTELESQKADLEKKVKEFEEKSKGVELGTIVVNPENATTQEEANQKKATKPAKKEAKKKQVKEVPPLEGKVLVVNKDYNFVVINLGNKDGIKVGDVFTLYHGDSVLTDVKVEKVHESMAAAGLVSLDANTQVSEGDKVIKKK